MISLDRPHVTLGKGGKLEEDKSPILRPDPDSGRGGC